MTTIHRILAQRIPGILLGIGLIGTLLLLAGCGEPGGSSSSSSTGPSGIELTIGDPQIQAVMAVQDRHSLRLLEDPEIVGTATGLTAAGAPAIVLLFKSGPVVGAPADIEGVPVVVRVTGELFALHHREGHGGGPGGGSPGGGEEVDPTTRFSRPVPIGISTGNGGQCSAGTIGARVIAGTTVYALSNNHVYALENDAPIGSEVFQPGLFDTGCVGDPNDVLGNLADFEPLDFAGADNSIDAAIAVSSIADLENATPSDGYGVPFSNIVPAVLSEAVQKYGRTTALTRGTITGINAILRVGYSNGTARFVGQILVQGTKPIIKAGDSGSLLVTDPGRNPVGLMFAGNRSGKLGVANPIDLVLARFGVAIDGE